MKISTNDSERPLTAKKANQEIKNCTDARFSEVIKSVCQTEFKNIPFSDETILHFAVTIYDVKETKEPINLIESNIAEDTTRNLKCSSCNEYMLEPIYICPRGHSLCQVCKLQITTCPFCRSKLTGGRNYALEELTKTLKVHCDNASNGCKYVGLIKEIKIHEEICVY